MANLAISGLTASAANLASTDLAPVVQTVGVGPVKMTGLQLAGGLLGSATFNGATVTTSQPVLNLSQTWNAGAVTFTGLKFNATDTASAIGSLLLDLQVGGVSQFKVEKSGNATIATSLSTGGIIGSPGSTAGYSLSYYGNGIWLGSACPISWSSGLPSAAQDTFIRRAAAATLQLGAADAAAPVAQTLQVQSVVAGTSNTAGANFTINGSKGTGTGAGGSIIFQVAPAGSSGTAQNAYSTALTIASDKSATFNGGTINVPDVANSQNNYIYGNNYGIAVGTNTTAANAGIWMYPGSAGRVIIGASGYFGFATPGFGVTGSPGTLLYQDAANTLALRNGANAQTYRIYATADGSPGSNFQRLTLSAGVTANMAVVAADNGGTGIAMGLQFGAALTTGGGVTNIMNINTSGHLVWNTDNTYDIGASGGSRPRNVYVAGTLTAATVTVGPTSYISFGTTRCRIYSPSTEDVRLVNGTVDGFGMLQFGNPGSTFPALKRVSANLQVIATDGTSSAGFIVGNQALATTATDGFLYIPTCAGTPTGTPTAQTGTSPVIYDTTNNKLYIYNGGWKSATFA